MLVTNIRISQYAYDSRNAKHQANVEMTLKDRVVRMVCKLDRPENDTSRDRAVAFVSDAIRQLKRMPEIRSGKQKIELSDSLTLSAA